MGVDGGMVLTVGCVLFLAAGFVFFRVLHIHTAGCEAGRTAGVTVVVSGIVLMLRITLIGLTSIHRRDTLSDEKCNEHVADAHGLPTSIAPCPAGDENGDLTHLDNG
ncbi:hypothetical protein [Bifidobacterium phasiani]|uniref:Uncharacterized protein n=1 Tax=Bifidobacterium phasiani TaxID=2834431 RepID=A0ABS6WBS4_9BIFI|nr:hypothetical protein [Bifidobacterium phasiani]MBW3083519.1 hypothetical protein [Bifidobacterium phasiani]